MKDLPHLHEESEVVRRIRHRTAVTIDLVDMDDSRARLCPPGNYLLRVAGARDQVGWLRWSRSSPWSRRGSFVVLSVELILFLSGPE